MVLATGLVLRDARLRRFRRAHQHGLRHERDGAQHLVGHRALPSDLRRLGRDHVFRDRLRDLAAPDRPRACVARAAAAAALAVVHRHDGDDAAVALARACRASGGASPISITPIRSSPAGDRGSSSRSSAVSCCSRPRCCSCAISRSCTAARSPALPRPLYALAVHPPHRVPAALNGFGLWNVLVLVLMLLAYGYPIAQFVIAPSPSRDRASGALGARHGAVTGSEPHVLDQPWRIWASVAVLGILLAGVVLGVLIIPVVQGRSAGIDAYTAICRALGILPGSPARQQVADRTPPTPVSQVVWTPERAANSRRRQTGARPRESAGGLRRLPRRAGRVGGARVSASCRPIGRGDLQAAATTTEPAAERIS